MDESFKLLISFAEIAKGLEEKISTASKTNIPKATSKTDDVLIPSVGNLNEFEALAKKVDCKKIESPKIETTLEMNYFEALSKKIERKRGKKSQMKGNRLLRPIVPKKKSQEAQKDFKCNDCDKIFLKKQYLHYHKRFIHGSEVHYCDKCPFKSNRKVLLQYHIDGKHNGKFACDQCDFKAARNLNLQKHKVSLHSNKSIDKVKSFKCNQCNYASCTKDALKYHLNLVHEGKGFQCPNCSHKSATKSHLKEHINGVHLQVRRTKKFPCPYCDHKATTKTQLRDHNNAVHNIK